MCFSILYLSGLSYKWTKQIIHCLYIFYDVGYGTYLISTYNDVPTFILYHSLHVNYSHIFYFVITCLHKILIESKLNSSFQFLLKFIVSILIFFATLFDLWTTNNKKLSISNIPDITAILVYLIYLISQTSNQTPSPVLLFYFSRIILFFYLFIAHADIFENIYVYTYGGRIKSVM